MEAVVVAGGLGSRLRPLTDRHPKHLLPVANVPFVVHQLSRLAAAGVRHVVLATSYRAEDFAPVLGDGSTLGLRLSYTTETDPLGTGGGARAGFDLLDGPRDEPVLVLNGDQMSDHDLAAQVREFDRAGADLSLHLVEVPDARAFGCVPTDADGRVTAFLEKSPDPVGRQVNAGCYVFSRETLAAIPSDRVVSLERDTFPGLLRDGGVLVGFRGGGYWADVGTPALLVRVSADLVRGVVRSPAGPAATGDRLVAPTAQVAPDALVLGGSSVGPGVAVGAGARVDGSVLMAGSVVDAGAQVTASVLGPGARAAAGSVLVDVAVGDEGVVAEGAEPPAGTAVPCTATWG